MTSSKIERVYTSLMRDYNGSFGFSISGGKGADPYIEGDEAVYISKVVEHGPAHRDGKIRVGDTLVQIDGIEVSDAEHTKGVAMVSLSSYPGTIKLKFTQPLLICSLRLVHNSSDYAWNVDNLNSWTPHQVQMGKVQRFLAFQDLTLAFIRPHRTWPTVLHMLVAIVNLVSTP